MPPPPAIPTIYETFGADLRLFLDTENPNTISLTGPVGAAQNEVVSLLSNDTSAVAINSLSSQRTIYNGLGFYTRGGTFLNFPSSTTFYNFIHENTPSSIAFRIYPSNGLTGNQVIFNNNNAQTTQRGWSVNWQDGNVNITITKGTSGQTPINVWGPGGASAGMWSDILIEDTGGAVTVSINKVAGTPMANAFTRGSGNAGFDLYIFRRASSGTWGNDITVKNVVFIDRLCTTDEKDLLYDYYLPGVLDWGANGIANFGLVEGQSNASGRATYAGSPAYFDDPTGAQMWNKTNATPDAIVNGFRPHQLGVNASSEGQDEAGPDIELCYRLNIAAPNTIYLSKYATTGSSMYPVAEPAKDWYYLSGTNDNAYRAHVQQMVYALKVLKYQLNKNINFCFLYWRQGESDTTAPNDQYGNYFERMLVDSVKYNAELHGFSVANLHIVVSSLDMFNATRPDCHNVVDGTQYVVDRAESLGFAESYQFSTIGRATSDGTHLTLASQILDGQAAATFIIPYLLT